MSNLNEITAADVEHSFGVTAESGRFVSLCNVLLAVKASSATVGYPSPSEKPSVDGSLDSEWTLSLEVGAVSGLAIPAGTSFSLRLEASPGRRVRRSFLS